MKISYDEYPTMQQLTPNQYVQAHDSSIVGNDEEIYEIIDQRGLEYVLCDHPDPSGEEENSCVYIMELVRHIYPALDQSIYDDGYCEDIDQWIQYPYIQADMNEMPMAYGTINDARRWLERRIGDNGALSEEIWRAC